MPTKKTSSRAVKRSRRAKAANTASPRRPAAKAPRDYAYVYAGQTPTHVMVPVADYERLLLAEMAAASRDKATDESVAWVDLDDYVLREAGQRIAAARKAKGVTQQQLGQKLGLAQTQVSRIERHPDRTSLGTIKRIAKALGVNISALVD